MKLKNKLVTLFEMIHQSKRNVHIYLLFALYMVLTLFSFGFKWEIGLLFLALLVAAIIYAAFYLEDVRDELNQTTHKLTRMAHQSQEDALFRSPIAVALYDETFRIRWCNPTFQKIYAEQDSLGQSLSDIDASLYQAIEKNIPHQWAAIQLQDKYYKLLNQPDLRAIYLMDVTKETEIQELRKYDKVVFGYLYLDDYYELVQSLEDYQEANIDAKLLNDLNSWAKLRHVYLKRLDEEKFMLLMNQQALKHLEKEKFKEIESIKERNQFHNVPISISMGIAYTKEEVYHIDELAQQAQLNLDLALGRGGNQIVVRAKEDKARFYGGKTNLNEKRTNTRSKLVYQALLNSIEQASNIFIAGHRYPDMDSMGSALAIYKLVTQSKKDVKIIINQAELNADITQLLHTPHIQSEWKQLFTDIETAQAQLNDRSLIIMVDHHRPSLSEAEALIANHDVVIIDHHRRSEEFPAQSVLTYIEPSASSAAELITEFFINSRNMRQILSKVEATALLAGIIVDTNNFSLRTGARTFDAASYLKSQGADTVLIQRLLKEDLSVIQRRNQLIEKAKYINENMIVVVSENDQLCENIVAAQAADTLLGLKDVEASFVIYRRSEQTVGISARSLGSINVQVIMEKLNGGGHLSNAATQLSDISVEQAYDLLLTAIQDY